jgi:hypothetical protein
MAIQNTDTLLVNRDGASYKLAATDDLFCTLQDSDVVLVNRSSSSYKLTGEELAAGNFDDTDLFMISRAGVSHQVPGSEIRPLISYSVPSIKSVEWSKYMDVGGYHGIIFRVRAYFDGGLDTSKTTTVGIKILSTKSGYAPVALTNIYAWGSTQRDYYKANGWTSSDTAEKQIINSTYFSYSTGGLLGDPRLDFDMEVPHTISVDGESTRTRYTAVGGGLWTGTVSVLQKCKGPTADFSVQTESDWWNS